MIQKLLRLYITVCWSFFVFLLLTLPMPPSQTTGLQITYADKLVHFFIFGLLSYFIAKTLELFTPLEISNSPAIIDQDYKVRYAKLNSTHEFLTGFIEKHHRTVLIASLLLPTFYGLMLEYLQKSIPGRNASLLDSAAGLAGSLLAIWIYHLVKKYSKPKLLLHICCVGCGAFVSQTLAAYFQVTLFFYNPNIYPDNEYELRLAETKKVAKKFGFKLLIGEYAHEEWLKLVKGRELDREKGERCLICYRERLTRTAKLARESGFTYFASTLTVSPHKLAQEINAIGLELALKYGVKFLNRDFKKQDGFKKSLALSQELKLYRQNYCGCEFSQNAPARIASDPPANDQARRAGQARVAGGQRIS